MVFSSSATLCTDDIDTVHMPVVSRDGIDSQGDWDPDHATSREPASDASSAHLGSGEVKILGDPDFGTQESCSCIDPEASQCSQLAASNPQLSQARAHQPVGPHAKPFDDAHDVSLAAWGQAGMQQHTTLQHPHMPATLLNAQSRATSNAQLNAGSPTSSDHPAVPVSKSPQLSALNSIHSQHQQAGHSLQATASNTHAPQHQPHLQNIAAAPGTASPSLQLSQAQPMCYPSQVRAPQLTPSSSAIAQHDSNRNEDGFHAQDMGSQPTQPHSGRAGSQPSQPHSHGPVGPSQPHAAALTPRGRQLTMPVQNPDTGADDNTNASNRAAVQGPSHAVRAIPRSREERLIMEAQDGVDLMYKDSPVQWVKKVKARDFKGGRQDLASMYLWQAQATRLLLQPPPRRQLGACILFCGQQGKARPYVASANG